MKGRERGGRKGERMLSRRPNRRFNGYILPLYPLRSPSLPLSNCLSSSRNRVTKTLSKQVLTDCCFLSGASRKAEGERAREGEAIAIRCIVAERNEDSGQSSGRCGGVQATSASRQKQRQESREGFEEARRKEGRKEDESEGKTRSSVRDDSFFPSFFPLFFFSFSFSSLSFSTSRSHQNQPTAPSIIIHLQAHPVVDLVVGQRDVVLEDGRPLLQPDLVRPRPRLCGRKLLEVANGVVLVALDADLLAEAVVEDDLDHSSSWRGRGWGGVVWRAVVILRRAGLRREVGGVGGGGGTDFERNPVASIVQALFAFPFSPFFLSPQLRRRFCRGSHQRWVERGDSEQSTVRTKPIESVEFFAF